MWGQWDIQADMRTLEEPWASMRRSGTSECLQGHLKGHQGCPRRYVTNQGPPGAYLHLEPCIPAAEVDVWGTDEVGTVTSAVAMQSQLGALLQHQSHSSKMPPY